jgi:LacI family transcriptional regulator
MVQPPRSSNARALTLKAVARAAGVSPITASFALNGHPRVALRTRQRVTEAATKLGFVNSASYAARRLARARSDSRSINFDLIGLLYIVGNEVALDPACLAMMRGVEQELLKMHASLVFVRIGEQGDWEKVERLARNGMVDGWLVVGAVDDAVIDRLKPTQLPHTILGDHSCRKPVHSVNIDHTAVAHLAVEHLAALGHRRVGFLAGGLRYIYQRETLEGFRAAMTEFGLDIDERLIADAALWSRPDGQQLVELLRTFESAPTALFIPEFESAAGICAILNQAGISVPEQMSVVGCESVSAVNRYYTRVEIALDEVGRHGAALLRRIASEPNVGSSDIRISPSFVKGSSTSPPSKSTVTSPEQNS